jgi:uncharacterized tellurite resistance protein B-like protein
MLFLSAQSTSEASANSGASSALALLVLIAVAAAWLGARAFIRRLRAGKAEAVVHGDFTSFTLYALANAARIDRRIGGAERGAIIDAMHEIAGKGFEASRVDAALGDAKLSKDELVAYLSERSGVFSREQKVTFLKALLGVLVADGAFDEAEHHALVEYTAAVGFDRESAPSRLRGMLSDMARDRIT